MKEYMEMSAQSDDVEESARFDVSGIHYDADEYVIPSSSICLLQQEMMDNWSDNDLWIAKNEIYARHGRMFGNDYLQQYFNQCSWYQGTISAKKFDDDVLNETEKKNVELLSEAKKNMPGNIRTRRNIRLVKLSGKTLVVQERTMRFDIR